MTLSKLTNAERVELLCLLAKAGASVCAYMPGAGNPEAWVDEVRSRCDCKFCGPLGPQPMTEQTGCCEIRSAFRILSMAI